VLVSSASSLLSHFLDTIRLLRVQGPLWLWQGAGCIYHIPNNSAFVETQTLFLKEQSLTIRHQSRLNLHI
jgi:hypothetical protein